MRESNRWISCGWLRVEIHLLAIVLINVGAHVIERTQSFSRQAGLWLVVRNQLKILLL